MVGSVWFTWFSVLQVLVSSVWLVGQLICGCRLFALVQLVIDGQCRANFSMLCF